MLTPARTFHDLGYTPWESDPAITSHFQIPSRNMLVYNGFVVAALAQLTVTWIVRMMSRGNILYKVVDIEGKQLDWCKYCHTPSPGEAEAAQVSSGPSRAV